MLFVYPLLADGLLLRHLEVPLLYNIFTEDMWELDKEALAALQYFTGTWFIEDIAKEINIEKKSNSFVTDYFNSYNSGMQSNMSALLLRQV